MHSPLICESIDNTNTKKRTPWHQRTCNALLSFSVRWEYRMSCSFLASFVKVCSITRIIFAHYENISHSSALRLITMIFSIEFAIWRNFTTQYAYAIICIVLSEHECDQTRMVVALISLIDLIVGDIDFKSHLKFDVVILFFPTSW